MKVGHLALHKQSRRLMTVVSITGRQVWCAWFGDGVDPRKSDAPLERGRFWQHQLSFDVAAVRARAEELGLGAPSAPDAGAGNV